MIKQQAMKTTKKISRENETEVLRLLEERLGGNWELHDDPYNCYDIHGVDRDGTRCIVEVKKRRQIWANMWIEADKVRCIAEKHVQIGAERSMLVNSIDGKHYMYDLKHVTQGGIQKHYMNNRTSSDFYNNSKKVEKDVYSFSHNDYLMELSEGELGHKYETTGE